MKSASFLIVVVVAIAGLGGWAWEHFERKNLEKQVLALTSERDVLLLAAKEKDLRAKDKNLPDGPQVSGSDDNTTPLEADQKPADSAKEKNPMAAMGEMMKDPAMREMVKSQMRTQIEFQYRDIIDLLELPQDKQEQLMQMLSDRASAGMDLGFAMMGNEKPSEEEMKKKAAELKAATEASDQALKEFLGEDDFSKFDRFEKSQAERQQLSTFNNQLKAKGMGLSEQAESQMMDAMFEERTRMKYEVNFADQKEFDPEKYTEANVNRFQEQQAVLREKVLSRAEEILTPEQLEIFQSSQQQQANLEKMSMEMALKMMGNTPKPPESPQVVK